MPWKVVGKCVVKISTGETIEGGCHETVEEAENHVKALYANVNEIAKELGLHVSKEQNDDGSYDILSISTVDRKDREGETFTKECMDFDANLAEKSGRWPEYRLFHKKMLGVGKVEKMYRIGDFAIEEGKSYTDPFSLQVCEKMLQNNDGTWKNSRGFFVYEAVGGCPKCRTVLKVAFKHMVAGYYCPVCKSLQADFRDELLNTRFTKARTFDITITDRPAVPWTATIAYKNGENVMTKTQLRKKMLEAGIDKDVIDEKLKSIDGDVLKELGNDLPFAEVLKEVGMDDETPEDEEDEEETVEKKEFAIEDSIIDEIAERVSTKVKEMLGDANFAFDVEGLEQIPVALKEDDDIYTRLEELTESVQALKEMVETLTEQETVKLAKKLKETPRAGQLRIVRAVHKGKSSDEDEEDYDEDEDDEDYEMMMKKKKEGQMPAFPHFGKRSARQESILDGQGKKYKTMTEMVTN